MKKRGWIRYFFAVLAVLFLFLAVSCRDQADVTRKLRDLGIPAAAQYTDGSAAEIRARCSWDMVAHEGNIYVGCGDYDTNMGPVTVWAYHPDEGAWHASDSPLPDEQIKRYAMIDGTLAILGTDPKADWDTGSYYLLEDGAWREHRVLPSGIHCFDTVKFEGKRFFGLGVNSGDFPVVVTEDGETFSPVFFLRDGEAVDTSATFVRVYNFVVFDGSLYAFLTVGDENAADYDVYRYDGTSFCYFSTPPAVFLRSYDMPHTGEFGGFATFLNGYCYFISEDMVNFRPWRVGDSDLACDVTVIGDTIYALAYTAVDDHTYQSAVYASEDGKTFQKLFYFTDEIPANCFVYEDGTFYFSMGRYYDAHSAEMGRVLAFDYALTEK